MSTTNPAPVAGVREIVESVEWIVLDASTKLAKRAEWPHNVLIPLSTAEAILADRATLLRVVEAYQKVVTAAEWLGEFDDLGMDVYPCKACCPDDPRGIILARQQLHAALKAAMALRDTMSERREGCRSNLDGECVWNKCPQVRDGEPAKSGRGCPLYPWDDLDARR